MNNLIQISKINDFLFCPYSIYLHAIYESFSEKTYHSTFQRRGKIRHKNVDKGEYSTAKKYLQGMTVFSEEYGLIGKIDIYNQETGELIERKYKIKEVYEGYKLQLYAQKLCLEEKGFEVKKLLIHSLSDNKRYEVQMSRDDIYSFFETLNEMRLFKIENFKENISTNKCQNCIYSTLCENANLTGF